MKKRIPLVKPQIDINLVLPAFSKILKSGIMTRGEFVKKFESKLSKFLKIRFAFATSSCTTALHLALVAIGIKSGDQVIVSDFSFPATGNVIVQTGAVPVFVDIDLKTFCMDIEDLKRKITLKTKAIMVVHAFGYPANMTEIMRIAKKHHLLVIEDAACALGSKHKDKFCGTWGDIGCFSFHPRKIITTGEGGAIVTNNFGISKKIEILRNQGGIMDKNNNWEFLENGYNYKMSELQAALGEVQMRDIIKIIKKRQMIAKRILRRLQGIEKIEVIDEKITKNYNFQSFVILLDKGLNRDKMIQYLAQKNIETTLGTYAMHAQKSFKRFGYRAGDLPNSLFAYKKTLTLPLFEKLSEREIDYMIKHLKKIINIERF